MKSILLSIIILWFITSCKSVELDPTNIVGKWKFTGIYQSRRSGGNFGDWQKSITISGNPILEFTNNGYFLKDGKSGAECCTFGDKYSLSGNKISFIELSQSASCGLVNCYNCVDVIIEKVDADSLILNECYHKNKYVRVK
jgi:hypothetical protein